MEGQRRKGPKSKITILLLGLMVILLCGMIVQITKITLNRKNALAETDSRPQVVSINNLEYVEELIGPYRFNVTGASNISQHLAYSYTATQRYYSKLSLLKEYEWLAQYEVDRPIYDSNKNCIVKGNSSMARLEQDEKNDKVYKAYLVIEVNTVKGTYKKLLEDYPITFIGPNKNVLEKRMDKIYYTPNNARYCGYIDVTDFVKSEGYGEYYCCNIPYPFYYQLSYDLFAAWKLIVIEENTDRPIKSLALKLGCTNISGSGQVAKINILGNEIRTAQSGTVTGQFLVSMAGADPNASSQHNSLKYSYDGTEAHEKAITFSNEIRTVKNPLTYVISKNGNPIDNVTNFEQDYYIRDGNFSTTPKAGYTKTGCTDLELIEVDGTTNLHNVVFANGVDNVSLKFMTIGNYALMASALGISVDIELPTYQNTLVTVGDREQITITGSVGNTYDLVSSVGLSQTTSVLQVDKGITIEDVAVTFTTSDGIISHYSLSEHPDLVQVNPDTNEIAINWGKENKGVTLKGDHIEFTVHGTMKEEKEKYENSIYTSGYLYTQGNKETNYYIDKIVSAKSDIEYKQIEVTKIWDDDNNRAGKRPDEVVVQLKQNDRIIEEHKLNESNEWKTTFFHLLKYDELGEEYLYTIDEKDTENIFYEKENKDFAIINHFSVPDSRIRMNVIKKWDDNDNEAGKRANSVVLQVKKEGIVVAEQEVNAENEWKHEFEVPKYDELGNEIVYTVDEKETDTKFYIKKIIGNEIINQFVVPDDRIVIKGKVEWDDEEDKAKKRDPSTILQIKVKDEVVVEAKVDEKTDWEYDFELPKYDENGDEIIYTLEEKESENKFYQKVEIENEDMVDQKIVKKFVVPKEEIVVKSAIEWEDKDDQYHKRPESVILQIKVEENVIVEQKIGKDDNWSYEFILPKYDEYGNEIIYTVDEIGVPEYYQKRIEGEKIVNSYTYVPSVDTGDKNIVLYITIMIMSIIGILIVGYFRIKGKK